MARKPTFTEEGKTCPRCKEFKPRSDYFKSKDTVHGMGVYCKPCTQQRHKEYMHTRPDLMAKVANRAREWRKENPDVQWKHDLKKYGITPEDYNLRLAAQGYRCAICADEEPGGRGKFHVDHCHSSGAVRGLLCHHCNVGIGNLRHRTDILKSAIRYLSTEGC